MPRQKGEEVEEIGTETEVEDDKGGLELGPLRGSSKEIVRVEGDVPPSKENADLPGFALERAHLLLQGVYGDFQNNNGGSHLYGGVLGNTVW